MKKTVVAHKHSSYLYEKNSSCPYKKIVVAHNHSSSYLYVFFPHTKQ